MLELSAIHHRPTDNFAYLVDPTTLHIRLHTKKDNIYRIELIFGDQYDIQDYHWVYYHQEMNKTGSDHLYDYWQVTINPQHKRVRYGFRLFSEDGQVTLTEKGIYHDIPQDPGFYYCLPYLHENEIFTPPKWVKDTVWYQIFPERFHNSLPSLNPENCLEWGQAEPSIDNFFGGDFQGIIDKLDYLEDLGITGIYLTPIFLAKSNHKYDTIDYFEIDPQFGDKKTLKELIEQCHQRGIRVMLDAVFNHSGYYFPPFQDVLEKGAYSQYASWFHADTFPLMGGEKPNYATFGFYEHMPKLNTKNPEVKNYLLRVASYWIEEFDIDGWRLDVANEIDHEFWRDFRKVVKAKKQDVFILGEIWHDSMPWLRGDQFDSVMNYPFLTNSLQFFAYDIISAKDFCFNITKILHNYPDNINTVLFNIIGSHDTARVINECRFDKRKVKLLFAFMFSFPGTPCIYYGDEIGLTGGSDPGCRRCMPWEEETHDLDFKEFVKKLISLRKSCLLLGNEGMLTFLEPTDMYPQLICYTKQKGDQTILILLNNSDHYYEYEIPFFLQGKKITSLLTDKEYVVESEQHTIPVHAFDCLYLAF